MATYTYINGDLSILKTVLENSGYFDSVETGNVSIQSETTSGLLCTIGSTTVFELGIGKAQIGQSVVNSVWSYVISGNVPTATYRGYFSGQTASTAPSKNNFKPMHTYQTEHGLSIVCSAGRILITKNQNGDVIIAAGQGYSSTGTEDSVDTVMGTLAVICENDDSSFRSCRVNVNAFSQTLPIPICTCSSTESYTDHAFWMQYKQNSSIGNIQYGGKRYFTDGFFAVEDEEEST